jgi:hypothetical protein
MEISAYGRTTESHCTVERKIKNKKRKVGKEIE